MVSQAVGELQQPAQPLVALQTQLAVAPLPLQVVPAGQAAPVEPQAQAPLVQRFALVASQVLQVPGVAPQLAVSMVLWQTPAASQQPPGHDEPSQTQPPATQRWPAVQLVPPGPHEQAVPTQRSAPLPQAVQAAPPVAQPVAGSGALQVLPAQQPPVQLLAQPVQAPLVHDSMPPQAVQAAPFLPQAASDGVTQLPPASQQPAHEVASQTQLPPAEQRCPVGQVVPPAPHEQPPARQRSALAPQVCVQVPPLGPQLPGPMVTQPLPLLQVFGAQTQPLVLSQIWLAPHWAPLQPHTPAAQVSLAALQSRQVEPLAPHSVSLAAATQVEASAQQPPQKRLEQTHWPLTHSRPAPQAALAPQRH
ncbi:MAG: hypothetical protein JWN44_3074 [Myxococcales bacterium]|nr:hypothetical protein [Myxococcales bacterium]